MIKYVVGFIFNEDFSEVILIKKNKPDWQKGLLNGVGGKIEDQDYEDPDFDAEFDEDQAAVRAMSRECWEETGLGWTQLPRENWTQVAKMIVSDDVRITFFFIQTTMSNIWKAKSITEEYVGIYKTDEVMHTNKIIPNLGWLLPLCIRWNQQIGPSKVSGVLIIEK